MKSILLWIAVSLLIGNVANGVPSDYNALSKGERIAQQKRCIQLREHTSISYDLSQTGGDDYLAIKIEGKVKYIEKKQYYPRYSRGIVADIDGNRLDDLIFEYWPGSQGLGLGSGIAVYLQRENGNFVKLILPAEHFSAKDIFDIDGDEVFEIVTAQLVKYEKHNYWLYRCWHIKDYKITNVDSKFDFPRAIWFTSKPNNKLVDKESARKITSRTGGREPETKVAQKDVQRTQKAKVGSVTKKGLASKYIADEGVENDPDVVFAENFEEGSLDAVKSRWESVKDIEIMSLSTDVPPGSVGKHSLLMTHIGGKGTGGHLYRRLLPGYEQLYVRFYVKFARDCYPIHHFVHVGGYNPPTPWPQGGAGIRPAGNERFTTGVEPYGSKWRWDFYSYWMGMRSSPDKKSWGHDFINDANLKVERAEWVCVELMMKMNDPVTEHNGQQAMWINGKSWEKDGQTISHFGKGFPKGKWVWDSFIPEPEGMPFEGFQWRSVEELKLNFLWILLYITKAPPGHVSKVWFDDIVVAKKYIGPKNLLEN